MAKTKASKPKYVPKKHLHSRVAFLHQAATYLSSRRAGNNEESVQPEETADSRTSAESHDPSTEEEKRISNLEHRGLPLYLNSQMLGVSLKGQIRISPEVKRTVCRRCNALLITGSTASSLVENKSRGGKKPWADVFVIKCLSCSTEKRFPVGVERQRKKKHRVPKAKEAEEFKGAEAPSGE